MQGSDDVVDSLARVMLSLDWTPSANWDVGSSSAAVTVGHVTESVPGIHAKCSPGWLVGIGCVECAEP